MRPAGSPEEAARSLGESRLGRGQHGSGDPGESPVGRYVGAGILKPDYSNTSAIAGTKVISISAIMRTP